jgi:hypothetical protein
VLVALGIQNSMRLRRTVSYACPALQFFSTLSHKRHDFRNKKVIELEMYVLIFSTTSNVLEHERQTGVRYFLKLSAPSQYKGK